MLIFIPLTVVLGLLFLPSRQFGYVILATVILSLIPFLLHFERKETNGKTIIIIAVMIALSTSGRLLFAFIPGFKPVTAIVILTALYFGAEAGFLTGALTAVISNFYFGQGLFTPFQMFAWGFIGLTAALLAKPLLTNKILLIIFGFLSGFVYSLLLDVWTAQMVNNGFNFEKYFSAISIAFLSQAFVYAVSNVLFLLLLAPSVGKILKRIKTKYGLK